MELIIDQASDDEAHFKVVDIPRKMHVNDGLHFVPSLDNDAAIIAQRRSAKPGERIQRQQAYGLAVQARMVASALEGEAATYFADLFSLMLLNAAWNERFGHGDGVPSDTKVMRSPIYMPALLIDPLTAPSKADLRMTAAIELANMSESSLIQADLIHNIGVRSERRAKMQHRKMGSLSVMLSALKNYSELEELKLKADRADWLREQYLATTAEARLIGTQIGQHPTPAALAEDYSDTVVHLHR